MELIARSFRPDNWRCSRRHSPEGCRNENVEYGQYEYKPQYIENDEKVAYSNPKYPWLVAAAKYKIAYKRPQDYDLVMLQKFPSMLRLGNTSFSICGADIMIVLILC